MCAPQRFGVLLALTACHAARSSIPGTPPDAATEAVVDAAPDLSAADAAAPDAAASAVTGAQVGHWLSDQPDLDGPSNLASTKISAWALEPDGKWSFLPGQGTSDGKFTVPGVPAGSFLLRVG